MEESRADNSYYKLTLSNRADQDQRNYFEEYGLSKLVCSTCHVSYGLIKECGGCGNRICEACALWATGKIRLLAFNKNKRTRKKQRYVLEYLRIPTICCNNCNKTVGYRL